MAFLRRTRCYSMMKDSAKVVVFETSIPVQLGFYALLEHNVQAAAVWDSSLKRFVGLMTVLHFVDILRHYHRRSITMEELGAQTLGDVRGAAAAWPRPDRKRSHPASPSPARSWTTPSRARGCGTSTSRTRRRPPALRCG